MSNNTNNPIQPVTPKSGAFVIVKKLPSGRDSYITFQYRGEDARRITGGFNLAIFNELMFANWYLSKFIEDVKKGDAVGISADDT